MIIQLTTLIIVILLIVLLFYLIKNAIVLVINSVVGFFALYGVNLFLSDPIPINFWSIIIVAIGGVFGLIIELILHFLGWGF